VFLSCPGIEWSYSAMRSGSRRPGGAPRAAREPAPDRARARPPGGAACCWNPAPHSLSPRKFAARRPSPRTRFTFIRPLSPGLRWSTEPSVGSSSARTAACGSGRDAAHRRHARHADRDRQVMGGRRRRGAAAARAATGAAGLRGDRRKRRLARLLDVLSGCTSTAAVRGRARSRRQRRTGRRNGRASDVSRDN
jgi:hypothetical protein